MEKHFRVMSAEEWEASDDLWLLLRNAEQQTGDHRKMALFGVGCCRRHWDLLHEESQIVLIEFEQMLDRLPSPTSSDICHAGQHLCHRANDAVSLAQALNERPNALRIAASKAVCYAVLGSAWGAYGYFVEGDDREVPALIHLARDIFANPFRPIEIMPHWRTEAVVSLARQMYKENDYTCMATLADKLETSGCTNVDVLSHCREGDPHYRGCWLVDRLRA